MLATCVVNGWDTAAYRHPEHPLQRAITDTIVELSGEPVVAVTVDGCGAPLHAYALTGLARAFGRIATAARRQRRGPRRGGHPGRTDLPRWYSPPGHPPRPRGRRAHRQGRRRVGVCGGPARRARRRREDRRRVPAGQGRRPRRRPAPTGRGRAGSDRRPRAPRRCSATAIPSAPSSPSASEGGSRMRAVLQRVTSASVDVDGEVVGAIDRPGLVALVGVTHDDGPEQVEWLARKIADLRLLRDEQLGPRRRGGGPRRQPVHPVRRRAQGTTPHLERRRARSGGRTGRRGGGRGAAPEGYRGRNGNLWGRHGGFLGERRAGHTGPRQSVTHRGDPPMTAFTDFQSSLVLVLGLAALGLRDLRPRRRRSTPA